MLGSILWMKRLAALALFAAVAVAAALLSGQIMDASPSTSIAPITVERVGSERAQNEPARTARTKQKGQDAKQRNGSDQTSAAESDTVNPTPLPAGDDDEVDDEEEADDDGPDRDDALDEDGVDD